MSTAEAIKTEEKIGKAFKLITKNEGDIKGIRDVVLGNGLPGHEHRIHDLEDTINHRRETCPIAKDHADKKGQHVMIWGLIINALIMVSGFATIALSIGGRL